MDPRGMVSRIYKEDHYILLHIKYESSGPSGFGEEDFSSPGPKAHKVSLQYSSLIRAFQF